MTKVQKFSYSLDEVELGGNVYKRFVEKYKNVFDEAIGILFSNEKYKIVDVPKFYYEELQAFVSQEAKKQNGECNFNEWVQRLAIKRAEIIKPIVDRHLIDAYVSMGGRSNWNNAFPLIFDLYEDVFEGVIGLCYRNEKYNGRKKEILNILHTLLYMDLEKQGMKGLVIQKSFKAWLATVLRNLANNKRNVIDTELCIDHYDSENKVENSSDDENSDDESFLQSSTTPEIEDKDNFYGEDESHDYGEPQESSVSNHTDDSDENGGYFVRELEELLHLMPNQHYAEVIRSIEIKGVSRSDYALRTGKTIAAVYNEINEAKTMLVRVALQNKPQRMRYIYRRSSELIEDKYQKDLLGRYLIYNVPVRRLSVIYKKREPQIWNDIIKAYRLLIKIHDSNYSIEYSHETE